MKSPHVGKTDNKSIKSSSKLVICKFKRNQLWRYRIWYCINDVILTRLQTPHAIIEWFRYISYDVFLFQGNGIKVTKGSQFSGNWSCKGIFLWLDTVKCTCTTPASTSATLKPWPGALCFRLNKGFVYLKYINITTTIIIFWSEKPVVCFFWKIEDINNIALDKWSIQRL